MTTRHHVERYMKLEDRGFALRPPEGRAWSIDLRLSSVRDLGERGEVSCYTLLLEQDQGAAYAPQGVYRLAHPELGEQLVLVVPLGGAGQARMRYEVVFN